MESYSGLRLIMQGLIWIGIGVNQAHIAYRLTI